MHDALQRTLGGLSALLLLFTGEAARAIPPPPPDDVRIVAVLDGNTIEVTPYGDPFQVRLACIQSLPLQQGTAGLAAKAALENLIQPGTWVTLAGRRKSSDGVEIAEIIAAGSTVPINLRLVQDGMAFLDHNASGPCGQDTYKQAELSARTQRLGLWGRSAASHPIKPRAAPLPARAPTP
jgi:endonuclease YncB( thermonuclease family)